MSRTWPEGDSITVELDAKRQPTRFSVNGRTLMVIKVRKRWQVDVDEWEAEGRVWRAYWRVFTSENGLFDIYYDFLDQTWHLAEQYD
jgi:hypothetical protein